MPSRPPMERCVAIIGAGILGRRIGCVFVAAGYRVHIQDLSSETLESALKFIDANKLDFAAMRKANCNGHPDSIDIIWGQVEKPGNPTEEGNGEEPDYTEFTSGIPNHPSFGSCNVFTDIASAVSNAWLVIEAVPEKLELKEQIFADLDAMTPPDCILGSNSSSFRSSLMTTYVSPARRKRMLNIHFTMPPKINIVELMTNGETDAQVLKYIKSILGRCGMLTVIAQCESTGFIFNRLWAAIKREIMHMLSEGVSDPNEIDGLWEHFFKNGPLPCQLMDEVGLDTVAFIEDNYVKERGLNSALTVDWLRKEYIAKGKLGRKSVKGGLYQP
ncbi:Dehydrogenase multihelical [Penicillium riverlandense]|uniref:Dehydrogenase multihelical n=1 Tax=Penicillium riverlandense TaxID=1903569 RepID=UPI002548C7DC|nr:Dehydrogenase multihelical [Penicillium riverlandense]KAJ5815543.1 Dehydrogenase multihelical [Penicillium riverlandense]